MLPARQLRLQVMADFKYGRCLGCHEGCFLQAVLELLYNGLRAGVRSTNVRSGALPLGEATRAAALGGAALGSSAMACLAHHRLTDREAAAATASGESKAMSCSWPRSSRNFLPSPDVQPMRLQVATRAATGPCTCLQTVPLAFPSLSAAAA